MTGYIYANGGNGLGNGGGGSGGRINVFFEQGTYETGHIEAKGQPQHSYNIAISLPNTHRGKH